MLQRTINHDELCTGVLLCVADNYAAAIMMLAK